jgi:hypothetical protein
MKSVGSFLNVSNALHGTSRISFNNDFQRQTHLMYKFTQFWIQFYIVSGLCFCNCHVATLFLDKTYNPCSVSQFKWVQTLIFLVFHKVLIWMSNAWKTPHHKIEEWCYFLVFECECLEQYFPCWIILKVEMTLGL